MTALPTPHSASVQLVIGRGADADFDRLGICPGEAHFRERRRIVVDAVRQRIEPMADSREVHYLAQTTVDGRDMVLLCITHEGSSHGDRDQTTIVRGAFAPERAKELIALGRGLAPFANELSGRYQAKKVSPKEKVNDRRTEVAIVG